MKREDFLIVVKILESMDEIGLILPDGWFGRPYDNFLFIDKVIYQKDCFFLILDRKRIKVEILLPDEIIITKNEITINRFKYCKFEWTEYVSGRKNVDLYYNGSLVIIARPLTQFKY